MYWVGTQHDRTWSWKLPLLMALAGTSWAIAQTAMAPQGAGELQSPEEAQANAVSKLNQQATEQLSAGHARGAVQAYEKALQLDPRNAKLHYNLALAFDRLGDLASERRELKRAIQLDSSFAVALNQLGLLALRTARAEEAEQE